MQAVLEHVRHNCCATKSQCDLGVRSHVSLQSTAEGSCWLSHSRFQDKIEQPFQCFEADLRIFYLACFDTIYQKWNSHASTMLVKEGSLVQFQVQWKSYSLGLSNIEGFQVRQRFGE